MIAKEQPSLPFVSSRCLQETQCCAIAFPTHDIRPRREI